MATVAKFGNAGFKYTPPGGVLTTHLLAAPLRPVKASYTRRKYVRDSLDYTQREVVVVGTGVQDAWFTIRYDNQPTELKTMLRHGLEGVTLTYYPNLTDTATNYPCTLIELNGSAGDDADILPDTDRWWAKEYMAEVRLRRTSGTFDALL